MPDEKTTKKTEDETAAEEPKPKRTRKKDAAETAEAVVHDADEAKAVGVAEEPEAVVPAAEAEAKPKRTRKKAEEPAEPEPEPEHEPEAVAEAPAEEPVAEEAPVDESVPAEEPVAEEAPVDESVPAEEPVAEEAPAAETAPAEEPVAAQPTAEEAVAEEAPTTEPATDEAATEQPRGPQRGPKKKSKRLPRAQRRQRPKTKREPATQRKPIVRLPKPESERGREVQRRGIVVSAAMDKTIVVRVDSVKAHSKYKKVIRRSTKFHAHDEQNQAKAGDVVRIVETRPLSKTKRWRLAEILEAAK